MIYLDNAATTFPKPQSVYRSMNRAMSTYLANPGRGGHKMSVKSGEQVLLCREAAAELFGVGNVENVIFTQNATMGLNTIIKGLLKAGDRVIISSFEHNAVLRPVMGLKNSGIEVDIARVYPNDDEQTVNSFEALIKKETKLMCVTHVSNVFGNELPVDKLVKLAHKYGVLFLLDASQSAGIIPINAGEMGIDYLCTAGHKGLFGPQGTGIMIINSDTVPDTLIEGGTGSQSLIPFQPAMLPDKYESGTLNTPGIIGLLQGIKFVSLHMGKISHRMETLTSYMKKHLSNIEGVTVYQLNNLPSHLFSFNINGIDCEKVSALLDKRKIAVRSGFHCAPLAHETVGTKKIGTVRVSPGYFNSFIDADKLINAVYTIKRDYFL